MWKKPLPILDEKMALELPMPRLPDVPNSPVALNLSHGSLMFPALPVVQSFEQTISDLSRLPPIGWLLGRK